VHRRCTVHKQWLEYAARVKKVNPKGNFLLPPPQQEWRFQEAVGGVGYCDERNHSSSEFHKSKVVKQQESFEPDTLVQWLRVQTFTSYCRVRWQPEKLSPAPKVFELQYCVFVCVYNKINYIRQHYISYLHIRLHVSTHQSVIFRST